jgi:Holliday junction DNA helicase RuvA
MIEYLTGRFAEKNPSYIVVDVNGTGYLVQVSLNTFTALSSTDSGTVFIHPVIREDAHLLFGFATRDERAVFRSLISVSGVGPNTARVILSSMNYSEVLLAISQGHVGAFQKIKGIGAKTAQRILVDLAGKMGKEPLTSGSVVSPVRQEAFGALVNLGFDRGSVEKVLDKIAGENNNLSVEQFIKLALKSL